MDDVAFTPDGRYVVSGGWAPALSVWDTTSMKRVRRLEGHTSLVTSIAVAADGRSAASAGVDGSVRLWDLETGRERSRLRAVAGRHVRSVGFSPDGRRLVSQVDGGSGHSGKRAPDIHLGLGHVDADSVLNVDVRWRGADGKLRSRTLQVTPGWHTVWLGAGDE